MSSARSPSFGTRACASVTPSSGPTTSATMTRRGRCCSMMSLPGNPALLHDHPLRSRDYDWVDHRQASGSTEANISSFEESFRGRRRPGHLLSQRWARRQDLRRRHRDHPHQPTAPATTATTAATAAAATSATTAGRAQHAVLPELERLYGSLPRCLRAPHQLRRSLSPQML